jgi:hypothetical protein
VQSDRNTLSGFVFDVSAHGDAPIGMLLGNCAANDNTQRGLYVVNSGLSGAPHRVQAQNFVADRNGYAGIAMAAGSGTCTVDGYFSEDCGSSGTEYGPWIATAGTLIIKRAHVRNVALSGAWSGILGASAAIVSLEDYLCEWVAGTGTKTIADVQAAGKLYLRNTRTVSTLTYGVYAAHAVSCSVYIDGASDLSSCTTPTNIDTTARANFGQVTLNGTNGVTVNGFFPAKSTIALSFNTTGTHGPTAAPFITSKASNTFTVQSSGTDNSTYDWRAT